MPRQILGGETQFEIFANPRMRKIESGIAQTTVERIILVFKFPGRKRRRNSLSRVRVESQRLSHFPRAQAIAVLDHVGGHGRSTLAVTLVEVVHRPVALSA